MEKSKPKPNPKKSDSTKMRKVSLPSSKAQSRIPINELRNNFRRQISLPKEKDIIPIFDPMGKAQESISSIRQKTGVIFDETMNEHYCIWDKNFPEKPERLTCILERCRELNLFCECEVLTSVSATKEQIMTVHEENLYETLKRVQTASTEELKEMAVKYQDMYMNQKTFEAATLSAGCCLEVTKHVLEGKLQNGMALVRPPGHHAMVNEYNGYCYFNNIALAARYALTKVNRVLIVDWDIHHGQGTQRIFYDDQRVLFFSTHRYENGKSWPHLRDGNYDSTGAGSGTGFSFNIPLNQTGMGNAEFLAYFHQVLLPVAYEFSPELVLISGGFDSALGDPKGMMSTTPAMYAHLTSMLMSLAGGKVVVLLEGGYCLDSLSEGAMHTLRTLMGKPCPRLIDPIGSPCQSMVETILNVISTHEPYWKSLSYQPKYDENSEDSAISQPVDFKQDILPKHVPKLVFEGPEPDLPGTIYPLVDYVCEYSPEENEANRQKLMRLKRETSLSFAPNRMCLVYDTEMEKHCNVVDKSFPERPARTIEIMKKLKEFGILNRVSFLKSRRAVRSELKFFHEDRFIDFMNSLVNITPRERSDLEDDFYSIYFHQSTWDCATLAAGSLLQVVDSVCSGAHQNGIGVIRPPGHHAETGTPSGFCFFNNVCIAAKYAQEKYNIKRVLILDWDVHHGNGTQHCFESDPTVLYISVHVYRDGNFFPFSEEANAHYVGKGPGIGYNVNIPWSKTGMGDGDYISAFTQVILPVAYKFDPDLVLVSAGFDAAVNDPLGGCCVTPECYGHLTHMLASLANGKVILALEGGYNLASISHAMTLCAKALLGDPLPRLNTKLAPSSSAVLDISKVISIHKEFWSCFKFQVALPMKKMDTLSLPKGGDRRGEEIVSDGEYFTPPTSPPDDKRIPVSLRERKSPPKTDVEEVLVSDFSKISLNSDLGEASGYDQSHDLEGAVGMDSATKVTIAQLLQEDNELHAVVPLTWCPHLEEVRPVPESGIEVINSKCEDCGDFTENWQCLTCYKVLCGRYVRKHMVQHGMTEHHNIVLSHSDLSVWCYACESYVTNEILYEPKKSAYKNKFGEDFLLVIQ